MTSEGKKHGRAFVWVWLPGALKPVVAGLIQQDGERYVFNYGRSYLEHNDAVALYLPELPLQQGQIDPVEPLKFASALRDGAPDAWGRRVIINRLIGIRGDDADMVNLGEISFLLETGSDRIGALDFQASATEYVSRQKSNASLEELQRASDRVEEGVPLTDELAEALQHGTAIGGARPKALIEGGNKKYIAKFSSSGDTYSVVKGEYLAMRLAQEVGLNVAPVKLERSMGRDVLLIERFDRDHQETGWSRKMLVSALTLFGLDEIMAAHASYTELAEIIRRRFTDPKAALRELFSRMIFNILVGNTDDHARNHAAFWDGSMLTLTPAYDICPQQRNSREASQAMLMGRERRSQLIHGLAVANYFHLSEEDARAIVVNQVKIIHGAWGPLCKEANLSQTDQKLFWRRQFLNQLAFEGVEEQFYKP